MSHSSEENMFSPDQGTHISENEKDESMKNGQPESQWDRNPGNARHWPTRRKWMAFTSVWLYSLLPLLCNSMITPALPEIVEKYHIKSPSVIGLPVTAYLLSSFFGPLLFAPLSEIYGRIWVLHTTAILSVAFNLACAFSPNFKALIIFRLLAGFSGSASACVGLGTVSDMFAEGERTLPTSLLGFAQSLNLIGPIIGGAITQSAGIKWVFITISVSFASASVIGILLLRETYSPVIQQRQAKRTVDPEAIIIAPVLDLSRKRKLSILLLNMKRPVLFLFRSPVCFILSLYWAILLGTTTLVNTQISVIFRRTYGFHARESGLVYLGPGCSILIAMLVTPKLIDYSYKKLSEKNGSNGAPEMRMPPLLFGSMFLPVGLLWFGWSVQARLHWIMPVIGLGLLHYAGIASVIAVHLYLVDVFNIYAASAIAANTVFSSILELVFPLFGSQMYDTLGVGGGSTLLASLAIVLLLPTPLFLYYIGGALRDRSQLHRCSS